MPLLVTSGAMLRCSQGTSHSILAVAASRGVNVGGAKVATVADNQPYANIQPFGLCLSAANPAVAGALTRGLSNPPCVPLTAAPWFPGSASVRAANLAVINTTCRCLCNWGGEISVITPAQQSTMVG